jgi:formylglycine-generating enzyme required for sulfatase activity
MVIQMKTMLTTIGLTLVLAATALAAPPQAVTDLSITVVDSAHVQLDWSPVTADTSGNPLDCVVYDLHKGTEAAFTPGPTTWLDSTSTTSYTDSLAGEMAFYRVQVQPCNTSYAHDMVLVPAGTFMMGQANIAAPVHQVTLTNDFLLGRSEVTNRQFVDVLNWALQNNHITFDGSTVYLYGRSIFYLPQGGLNVHEIRYNSSSHFYAQELTHHYGSWGPGYAYPSGYNVYDHPVMSVSWYAGAAFCDLLSLKDGLSPVYTTVWGNSINPYSQSGYRLPTESEWEYAAQFPDGRVYPWGNELPTCELVNRVQGSIFCVGWTSPVGNYPAGNAELGFQDMAGNLVEWCHDGGCGYSSVPVVNPYCNPILDNSHILRGGHFYTSAPTMERARRWPYGGPGDFTTGFRICRTAP